MIRAIAREGLSLALDWAIVHLQRAQDRLQNPKREARPANRHKGAYTWEEPTGCTCVLCAAGLTRVGAI